MNLNEPASPLGSPTIRLSREEEIELLRARLQDEVASILSQALKDSEAEGLTRQELANRIGSDPATVSRWFTHGSNWRLSSISDLASALGIRFEVSARSRDGRRLYAPDGQHAPAGLPTENPDRRIGVENDPRLRLGKPASAPPNGLPVADLHPVTLPIAGSPKRP